MKEHERNAHKVFRLRAFLHEGHKVIKHLKDEKKGGLIVVAAQSCRSHKEKDALLRMVDL